MNSVNQCQFWVGQHILYYLIQRICVETLEEIAREKNVVRSIFASAVKRGYLKENPFKGNRQALYVTEPEKDFYLVSRDEL